MSNPVTNVINNIKGNKILLYSTIIYVVTLIALFILLIYIISLQQKNTGLTRVVSRFGWCRQPVPLIRCYCVGNGCRDARIQTSSHQSG